jgi:7-cyano-7-deazaguanine synthase
MRLPGRAVSTARQVAVLASGGLDSAVLVADQASTGWTVHPIYVRFGLAWEDAEEAHLRRFLGTLPREFDCRPLVVLALPIADVYGTHWSVSGTDVPDETTPDSAVYLPGRNLLLLSKPSVWCVLHDVDTIALGTLKGNPFADSGADFLARFGSLVELGLDRSISVITPLSDLTKSDVLDLGRHLELQHTFSCIAPVDGRHCGWCNKCAERRNGFAGARMRDPTPYANG